MLTLKAVVRKEIGRKSKNLAKKGILPAVLYGPEIETMPLQVDKKEFQKVFEEGGESSLIALKVEGKAKEFKVLIHDVQEDFVSDDPIHIDFYEPLLTKAVEATVPLVFVGEALAEKELGGILVKEIQEVEVSALPEKLPREIEVDVSGLKTFENEILIKDLKIPQGVEVKRRAEDIVALVVPPKEEDLEVPVEEKVEEVKTVEKKEEEEGEGENSEQ